MRPIRNKEVTNPSVQVGRKALLSSDNSSSKEDPCERETVTTEPDQAVTLDRLRHQLDTQVTQAERARNTIFDKAASYPDANRQRALYHLLGIYRRLFERYIDLQQRENLYSAAWWQRYFARVEPIAARASEEPFAFRHEALKIYKEAMRKIATMNCTPPSDPSCWSIIASFSQLEIRFSIPTDDQPREGVLDRFASLLKLRAEACLYANAYSTQITAAMKRFRDGAATLMSAVATRAMNTSLAPADQILEDLDTSVAFKSPFFYPEKVCASCKLHIEYDDVIITLGCRHLLHKKCCAAACLGPEQICPACGTSLY